MRAWSGLSSSDEGESDEGGEHCGYWWTLVAGRYGERIASG